jgi:hypothetical protein
MDVKDAVLKMLKPTSLPCYDFTDERGVKSVVTAIIVPTSFHEKEGSKLMVGWSCSKGRVCRCPICVYSLATVIPGFEKKLERMDERNEV